MLNNLQVLFDRSEQQRHSLLQQAEGLNADQLSFQPKASEWSLMEHIHHLTLTEQELAHQASHPKLVARLAKEQKGRVPFGVVWLILRCGIRVPVPVDSVLPLPGQSLPLLTAQWEQARSQIKQLLEALPVAQSHQPFAIHPVCGALTPAQILQFTLAHGHYHLRQMQRLRHQSLRVISPHPSDLSDD